MLMRMTVRVCGSISIVGFVVEILGDLCPEDSCFCGGVNSGEGV